jgi:hypothetical protein
LPALKTYAGRPEVAAKLARRRSEMEEEAELPKPEKRAEKLPWAEISRESEEASGEGAGGA